MISPATIQALPLRPRPPRRPGRCWKPNTNWAVHRLLDMTRLNARSPDRRAHRHRRRRARRQHGPRGPARGRSGCCAAGARRRGETAATCRPRQPLAPRGSRLPPPAEVVAWNRRCTRPWAELQLGRMPIPMGGDHCPGHRLHQRRGAHRREPGKKAARAVARRPCRLQHPTPSRPAAMSMACRSPACGFGPQALIEMSGRVPAISPEGVRQIGIRSVDEGERRFVHEPGLDVFDMRFIDETGMRATMSWPRHHGRPHAPCTSASTSTFSTPAWLRRRHHGAGRPHLPRPTCAWR